MLADNVRLVSTRSAEFFKDDEFFGGLRALECDGCFVAEFRDTAVGVDVDEVEGRAGPVLGDVGVGEFVAAA